MNYPLPWQYETDRYTLLISERKFESEISSTEDLNWIRPIFQYQYDNCNFTSNISLAHLIGFFTDSQYKRWACSLFLERGACSLFLLNLQEPLWKLYGSTAAKETFLAIFQGLFFSSTFSNSSPIASDKNLIIIFIWKNQIIFFFYVPQARSYFESQMTFYSLHMLPTYCMV